MRHLINAVVGITILSVGVVALAAVGAGVVEWTESGIQKANMRAPLTIMVVENE